VSRGVTSAKRDNWVDIIGYAALGSEIEANDQSLARRASGSK